MKRFVRPGAFLLLAALLFCLSGCYSGNIDQYFSLPMASEEYRQLQSLIDEELASGSEYAAPIHGSYRQSVQLSDVDGDGADEALAFFRDAAKNPKINIYDSENGEHRLALSISGEGSSIGRIDYADLTGDGQKELLVSWQISSGLSVLGVYSLAGWSGDVLLSTDSAEFVTGDINRDGCDELLNLRAANSTTYLVDQYTFPLGQEPQATSAALSAGISALQRLRMVTLAGDAPALLAESTLTTGDLVSDLFVCRDGSLINLTMNRTTQISETRRSYSLVYAQDIDGDGSTEIPHPQTTGILCCRPAGTSGSRCGGTTAFPASARSFSRGCARTARLRTMLPYTPSPAKTGTSAPGSITASFCRRKARRCTPPKFLTARPTRTRSAADFM